MPQEFPADTAELTPDMITVNAAYGHNNLQPHYSDGFSDTPSIVFKNRHSPPDVSMHLYCDAFRVLFTMPCIHTNSLQDEQQS